MINNELIDIYDGNRKHIGVADRKVAHTFALWHKTVHCWIVLSDGRLVFQRRGPAATSPGKLYTTASGHLSAGDTIEQAFAREVKEEVGIKIDIASAREIFNTVWVADIKYPDGSPFNDRAFAYGYAARYDGKLTDFKFQDGEVDAVAAIDPKAYLRLANGEVAKIPAKLFDGKTTREIELTSADFCLVGADTLYSKFGTVCEAVMRVFA
ncbi:MAG: NUDIX domain-containing protein [Alphaproteobacteria bacterium]|nr:NUDIX domain-containing protein [Alphaproteobacteria bacterium]